MPYLIFILLILFSSHSFAEAKVTEVDLNELPVIALDSELRCLALNIYHEARGDSKKGRYSVADVVLNRVEDENYPDSICKVIKQGIVNKATGKLRLHSCQFSWICDGRVDTPKEKSSWKSAQLIAYNIVEWNHNRGITNGATNYHATYVHPNWANSLTYVGTIGQHRFYLPN